MMDKLELKKTERMEDLGFGGYKFIQNKDLYCFTSDAVLLANFVKTHSKDVVCDFCSGSGIVAVIVAGKNNVQKVIAVEIQKEMADLAKKNVELNGLENKIFVICDSVQNFSKNKDLQDFDVIVCNPPYKKREASYQNENQSKAIARHEIMIDMKELCESVAKTLKYGGKFYVCYDSNRSAELIAQLKNNLLEPKRMFFTYSGLDKNSTLVFIEAEKGGKEGITILPPFYTNDKDGNYVANIIENYKRK